ncbi:GGDEF domain-containing protein [Candidatus Poribacteria bacterium]
MCKEDPKATIRRLQEELEAAKKQIALLQEKSEKFERLSITDGLTGLYNQRHFHDRLKQEVARNRRQEHPLCLLFFDVDGLKTYNDTYGHSGGDEVLKTVAQSLSQSIRKEVDSGYRYGGDEFIAILPEVRATQTVEIARRVISHLQGTDFHHVSLSFGVAELGPAMDSETLFRHADEAMYMAKKSVEDKIRVHRE